jgi:acetyl esterase/lipase
MHRIHYPQTDSDPIARSSRRTIIKGLGAATGAGLLAATASRGTQIAAQENPTVTYTEDVVYAEDDGQPQMVNIASPPDRGTPRPAVVVIHPGGMTVGDRTWMEEEARGLAAAGYVAFSIDYRLFVAAANLNLWPAQLEDAQRAVRWVRANAETYGVDPDRLGALGYSAGGKLAAMLGTRDGQDDTDPALAKYSSRVSCVVDLAGPIDPAIPFPTPDDNASQAALLGGTPDEVPNAYKDYSVLSHIDGHSAPFLVLHGTKDTIVPVANSRKLVDSLHEHLVEAVYGEFPTIDHLDWTWALAGPLTRAFLDTHLEPET